jgi:hypothetical protein
MRASFLALALTLVGCGNGIGLSAYGEGELGADGDSPLGGADSLDGGAGSGSGGSGSGGSGSGGSGSGGSGSGGSGSGDGGSSGSGDGGSSNGGGSGSGGGGAQTPVGVSIDGRTYEVELADVTVVQPAGLQPFIQDTAEGLLFHVSGETSSALTWTVGLSKANGSQNTCEPVFELPRADWSANPEFAIRNGSMEIPVNGAPVGLDQLSLETVVAADGRSWDGELSAMLDLRDLESTVAEGTDLCALVAAVGAVCEPCGDGADQCVYVQMEVEAEQVSVGFDDTEDGRGC